MGAGKPKDNGPKDARHTELSAQTKGLTSCYSEDE